MRNPVQIFQTPRKTTQNNLRFYSILSNYLGLLSEFGPREVNLEAKEE